MRFVTALALVTLPVLCQETGPDALEILRRAESKYRTMESYRAELVQSSRNIRRGGESSQRHTFRLTYRRPGKLRREVLDGSSAGGDLITNGETSYFVNANLKEYIQRAVTPPKDGVEPGPEPMFLRMAEGAARATIVRAEVLPVEGRSPKCWVIETTPRPEPQPQPRMPLLIRATYWVEQGTYAIWKVDRESDLNDPFMGRMTIQSKVEYRSIEFGIDLPDSLFAYTPPADYKKVEQFDMVSLLQRPAGNLEGKPAPPFTLLDTDGKEVSLEALRGKVVLLNFWATWCAPCRAEMPLLELLDGQFRGRGLAVVGISDEAVETIASYWKANGAGFPTLRDPGGKVKEAYGVQGLPSTFLIARDGRVSFAFTGPLSGSMVKEALRAQRIWTISPE